MARRVLIPMDGTKNAEAVLPSLEDLCSPEDEITLLLVAKPEEESPGQRGFTSGVSVVESIGTASGGVFGVVGPDRPVPAETTGQTIERQIDEAKGYLERIATEIRQKGFRVDTEVLLEDSAADAIIEYAKRERPSLIVMLRRTNPGLREIIFGSTASSIVRSEVAPVLFVPTAR